MYYNHYVNAQERKVLMFRDTIAIMKNVPCSHSSVRYPNKMSPVANSTKIKILPLNARRWRVRVPKREVA